MSVTLWLASMIINPWLSILLLLIRVNQSKLCSLTGVKPKYNEQKSTWWLENNKLQLLKKKASTPLSVDVKSCCEDLNMVWHSFNGCWKGKKWSTIKKIINLSTSPMVKLHADIGWLINTLQVILWFYIGKALSAWSVMATLTTTPQTLGLVCLYCDCVLVLWACVIFMSYMSVLCLSMLCSYVWLCYLCACMYCTMPLWWSVVTLLELLEVVCTVLYIYGQAVFICFLASTRATALAM